MLLRAIDAQRANSLLRHKYGHTDGRISNIYRGRFTPKRKYPGFWVHDYGLLCALPHRVIKVKPRKVYDSRCNFLSLSKITVGALMVCTKCENVFNFKFWGSMQFSKNYLQPFTSMQIFIRTCFYFFLKIHSHVKKHITYIWDTGCSEKVVFFHNWLQPLPSPTSLWEIFKALNEMRVYSHSYWMLTFCTTNSSRVLARQRWQTFENNWKNHNI